MFKRFLACLIIACLCLSLLPAAYAAGDGEWDFDAATGTLHLKGTGTMDELFAVRSSFGFLKTVSMPWRDTENLRRVEIGEGITDSPFADSFEADAVPRSKELSALYEKAAFEFAEATSCPCGFLDAARIIQPSKIDSLHLMPDAHETLAAYVTQTLRAFL